ncbi:hypothetical protein L6452_37750 [Arctium lappa]|uniref:Uncharacterized protein n=1 Tax=Arctium lappa TaxID=4217 RepID=A0ACB8Y3U7_ARCLA|nr:hypothetical protein L6452_37750 [Arctium lappa]
MLRKKICLFKKLAKEVAYRSIYLNCEVLYVKEERLLRFDVEENLSAIATTPRGFLAVYVGDERRRFVVSTSCLSHPLFKILLAKAYEEFGYEQKNGLTVPCSVAAFREVVMVMKCCSGMFDFRHLVQEFIGTLEEGGELRRENRSCGEGSRETDRWLEESEPVAGGKRAGDRRRSDEGG